MRRSWKTKPRGGWKTGAISAALSASAHVAAIGAAVVGGLIAGEPESRAAEWGAMEVVGRREATLPEVPALPPERPKIEFRPTPTPPIEWVEEEVPLPPPPPVPPPQPELDPPERTRPMPRETVDAQEETEALRAASATTTAPLVIENLPPDYPETARRRGYQGVVTLLARVSSSGELIRVTIEESSGYPILDRAAKKAVMRWTFRPGTRDGIPVESEVEIPIRFRLPP